MSQYDSIPIRPMRLRGVLGISWNLMRRRFFATTGFVLLFYGLVSILPLALSFGVLEQMSEQAMNGFYGRVQEHADMVSALWGSVVLAMLSGLLGFVTTLVLKPIVDGGLSTEMSMRFYGMAGSFRDQLRRSKHLLKRYFTTNLSLLVVQAAVGIVVYIVFVMFLFIGVFSLIPALALQAQPSDAVGWSVFAAVFVLMLVLIIAAGTAMLFFLLTYPVAVNEGLKNFQAIKRSFVLVKGRFWRMLGAMSLYALIVAALCVMGMLLTAVGMQYVSEGFLAFGIIYFLALEFLSIQYASALAATLYFDARVREMGEEFFGNPPHMQSDESGGQSSNEGDSIEPSYTYDGPDED